MLVMVKVVNYRDPSPPSVCVTSGCNVTINLCLHPGTKRYTLHTMTLIV